MSRDAGTLPDARELLPRLRAASAALVVAPALVAIAALRDGGEPYATWLAAPASLAGLLTPVVAHRIYHAVERGIGPRASREERAAALRRATLRAMGVSAAMGLAGAVVGLVTRDVRAFSGPVLHLVVAGALWPTRARAGRFLGDEPS